MDDIDWIPGQMTTPTELMDSFVHAAVSAQRKMEGWLTAEYLLSQRPVDGALYSFRSISFDLQFMLEKASSRKFLFLFRSTGPTTRLVHKLSFALHSEPSPPLLPIQADGGTPKLHLSLPVFMLTSDEDLSVRQAVKDAMENARWTARLDASKEQVLEASKELLKDPVKDRGCLAFRLEQDGSQFLVVSVTQKGDPDGLYLYLPNIEAVIIFALPSVQQDKIEYEPLHQFGMALYTSLFGAISNQKVIEPVGATGMISGLDLFVDQLNQSYGSARQLLATSSVARSPLPSYLEIGPLKAELRYSASSNAKNKAIETSIIQNQGISISAPVEEDDMRAVVGTAEIVITSNGSDQETKVIIGTPSFILSGNNLNNFVELARSKQQEIASAFGDDSFPIQSYIDALRSRHDVVALQSFTKDRPDGNLLALWPGTGSAAGRHFVFKCHIDSKAQSMDSVSKVLALGQDLADAKIAIGGDDNQYGPFHNAFHSILLWSIALRDK